MSRCVAHNVLPKCFQTKPVIRTKKGYTVTKEYNWRMLKTAEREIKYQYHQYLKHIKELEKKLKDTLSTDDMNIVITVTDKSKENKYVKDSKRLKAKFENLIQKEDVQGLQQRAKIKYEVFDITKDGIDEDVKAYLKLGPDFSETPRRLPYEKIIIETEKMCKVIEEEKEKKPEQANELEFELHKLREKVKKLLTKSKRKKIKSNLTEQEIIGKKKAYKEKDLIYVPADKGKVMVAMDRTMEKGGENSYEYKMKKVLEDMKAKPSIRANKDWDLTEKVAREGRAIIQEMVNGGEITQTYGKWLKPNDCRAPRITGFPKIHKDEVPLRGVVSFIGSPYEKVAGALVPILRSLQGRSGHYIKNSRELKEKIKTWSIQRDEILVSYDVEKLYPSIPIKKALELIECLLKCKRNLKETTTFSIQSIMNLLKWIFSLTYCEYGGSHYVLDCGPIGLSVVGEVAIIYMEDFQLRAKTEEYPELNDWPWYVDDSVLKCKRDKASDILNHLNSIEPEDIKFTKEEEENNTLAVLDLELNVNRKRKKVEFNIHYKKTNTNIMIKKHSNHKNSIKMGVIKGYSDRAKALCDSEYLETEMKNIEEIFVANGYQKEEIQKAMKGKDKKSTDNNGEELVRGIVSIPNVPGVTSKFNRIAKQHGFRATSKTENKVRDLVSKAKTPLGEKNSHVVYNIPCKCAKYCYTGETDRKWETRKKEHQAKVRLTKEDIEAGDMEKAAERMNDGDGGLAKHATRCEQEVDWENAKIVGKEKFMTQRKYLEGIESLRHKFRGKTPLNSFNQLEHWQSTVCSFFEMEQVH